jgi:hypothetical protein
MTQAVMAENIYLKNRVSACAAQEGCWSKGIDPDEWAREWRKVWASAEGWDTKWEEAQNSAGVSRMAAPVPLGGPIPQEVIDIGQDPDVITDEMIRDQVIAMKPFTMIESWKPEMNPNMMASRRYVQDMLDPHNRIIAAMKEALDEVRGEVLIIPPPTSD